jgi:tetratricopeptide (TPR) repeat protein
VGSLFHEAMKFRENFYQRSAYGPKVRALRRAALRDESGLVAEFEKLIEAAGLRIDESLQELSTLLRQTTSQFRILLAAHAEDGALARIVATRSRDLAAALEVPEPQLMADLYGGRAEAWSRAGASFLVSGFFEEARAAYQQAALLGSSSPGDVQRRRFAEGMTAYLAGRYADAVKQLGDWIDSAPPRLDESDAALAKQARAALSRVGTLAGAGTSEAAAASRCLDRLGAVDPAPPAARGAPSSRSR